MIPTAKPVTLYMIESGERNCYYAFTATKDGFYRLAVWQDENLLDWRFGWRDLLKVDERYVDPKGCDTMLQAMSVLRAKFVSRHGHFVCVPIAKLAQEVKAGEDA